MHIRQSDTTYDDVDHDIDLSASADEHLTNYLMRRDLELSVNPFAYVGMLDAPDLRAR
jgi:hypothetical protein